MDKVILSLLFPTASSVPTVMFLIIAYVVGAVLASALAIRTFRFMKQRRSPTIALPKPVSGAAASRSTFSFGRTTWLNWTRPWTRAPLAIAHAPALGKAAMVANTKKLAIELLPTTGLPPNPRAIPTPPPIAQLVDLGPPHTPPPSEVARSGHPFSYHDSPRSSSPSPRRPSSPIIRPQSVIYPSGRRSPSPQALLATSPPRNHQRTRSLGGVVVRRLSGGYSGLRNQVDLEMKELLPSHTRGTSRDQLLVDFSPSDNVIRFASSNSSSYAESAQPLLDVGDDPFGDDYRASPERVDDQWKWFGPSSPMKVESYDSRSNYERVTGWPVPPCVSPSQTKLVAPVPIPIHLSAPNPQQLIDIALEHNFSYTLSSFDSGRTLVEPLEDKKVPLIDPFGDDFPVDLNVVVAQEPAVHSVDLVEVPDLKEVASHTYSIHQPHETSSSIHLPLSSQRSLPFGAEPSNDDQGLTVTLDEESLPPPSTPPLGECSSQQSPGTSISELEKESSNEIPTKLENSHDDSFEQTEVMVAVDLEHEVQQPIYQQELVEKSPEGSLLPTSMNDQVADEEVPELDLDSECVIESDDATFDEEDEDDATPKATPTSDNVELLPEAETLPTIIELSMDVVDAQSIEYPDPDLLPLPEFIPNKEQYLQRAATPPHRLQMPTPPASPPSMSPIRLSLTSYESAKSANFTSVSPQLPTEALTPVEIKSNSTLLARPVVIISAPFSILTSSDDKDDGATPVAVVAKIPVWTDLPSEKVEVADVFCEDEDSSTEEDIEERRPESSQDAIPEESLPGSFPDLNSASSSVAASSSIQEKSVTTTIGARLASASVPSFRPSARDIIRQPLEIALAMQLRPGLGAGADPAWMVRFLMAMFGWLAVVVSGQPEF